MEQQDSMEQQQSLALPTVEAVGVRMLEAVAEVDVVARSPQSSEAVAANR